MIKLEIVSLFLILICFALNKKNILTTLFTLEIYRLLIIITIILKGGETFHGLLLICVGACEGAVGLGTLVSMVRMKTKAVETS